MGVGAVFVASLTIAAPWFVDGDAACPGTGSSEDPFCGMQEAFDGAALQPGDEIVVRDAATLYGEASISNVDGAADQPIVIRPDEGHAPIMGGELDFSVVSHWTVRDLTFDGSGGSSGPAVDFRSGDDATTGNTVEGNTFIDWNAEYDAGGTTAGIISIASFAATPNASNPVVRNNRIIGGGGRGVRVRNTVGGIVVGNEVRDLRCQSDGDGPTIYGIHARFAQGIRITGNRIEDMDSGPCHDIVGGTLVRTVAILLRSSDDAEVDHNYIRAVGSAEDGEGLGVNLMHGADDASVHHNIVVDAQACGVCSGVQVSDGGFRQRFVNNTIVGGSVYGIEVQDPRSAVVFGNLIAGAQRAQIRMFLQDPSPPDPPGQPYSWTIDNNLYFPPRGSSVATVAYSEVDLEQWRSDCDCDASAVEGDPMLPAGVDDFTVGTASPAVDLGVSTDEVDDFNGEAPDVGALEAPLPESATVSAADPDRVALQLANAGIAPLQLDGACAGFTLTIDGEAAVLASCESAGDDVVILRLASDVLADQTLTLAYSGNAVRDSARVGGSIDSLLQPFDLDVVNDSQEDAPATPGDDSGGSDGSGDTGTEPDAGGDTTGPVAGTTSGEGDVDDDDTGGANAGAYPEPDACTCRNGAPPTSLMLLTLLALVRRRVGSHPSPS